MSQVLLQRVTNRMLFPDRYGVSDFHAVVHLITFECSRRLVPRDLPKETKGLPKPDHKFCVQSPSALRDLLAKDDDAWKLIGEARDAGDFWNIRFSVEERVTLLGYNPTRDTRDDPSRQIIEAHGIGHMRHIMGVSCLFFSASPILFAWFLKTHSFKSALLSHKLALAIAVDHVFQTFLSFTGDYWYGENDAADPWWHETFHYIDVILSLFINIPIQLVCALLQLYYCTKGRKIIILALISGALAIICQKIGTEGHRRAYWDTGPQTWTNTNERCTSNHPNCGPSQKGFGVVCKPWSTEDYKNTIDMVLPDRRKLQCLHIWYILFFHTLWHVFASIACFLQLYTLLFYPFDFEARKNQEDNIESRRSSVRLSVVLQPRHSSCHLSYPVSTPMTQSSNDAY